MVSPQNIKSEREVNARGDVLGRLNVAKIAYGCPKTSFSQLENIYEKLF